MKKKAEDLKRGDVVVFSDKGPSSLLRFMSTIFPGDPISGDFAQHATGDVFRYEIQRGCIYEVESPTLSPAQQHAEELLEVTRLMFDFIESPATAFYNEHREQVRALLARIDPPKPPSVEELAQVISEMINAPTSHNYQVAVDQARGLLGRARAAGYLGRDSQ